VNLVDVYAKIFEKFEDSDTAYKFMVQAYTFNKYVNKFFPDKKTPKSINKIMELGSDIALRALKHPEKSVITNVFFPCELLHAMDVYPLFMEGIAASMAGSHTEKKFIENAEKIGIPETYCTFHKIFLGGVDNGFFPRTKIVATTSLACDANVNSFRYIAQHEDVEGFVIDVPYDYSEESLLYLEQQLKEFKVLLEKTFGRKLDEKKLKEVIERENETIRLQKEFLKKLAQSSYPNVVGAEMGKIFITTVGMGTKEALEYYQDLIEDIDKYPKLENKKRILWVNLLPFTERSIQENLDFNEDIQLLGCDINLIPGEELDSSNPYRALAKKLINHFINGSYTRRIARIKELAKELQVDGVINMCQWGCKQSAGGAILLKKEFEKMDLPFLSLDGDTADKKNNGEGQLRTRLEAFLEILRDKEVNIQ
jgi:benzoyl-CoA reductase/2-hydroxyglutaryl-CoA dehydratase subunit BcrC/BadD/HgdB